LRAAAALAFFGLLAALWLAARAFGVAPQLTPTTIAAVAILLAPFWAFGFGLAAALPKSPWLPMILVAAYPLFALPRGIFRWDMFLGMAAVVLAVGVLLTRGHHWIVLAILGISVDLRFFDAAWPVAGLNSMTKLMFVDAGLYGFLVLHPIGGIGYDFRPKMRDFGVGLREFLFFTPIAIALGFALAFLHAHKTIPAPVTAGLGWIFTLFFIAVPEELFFRGLLLNLLERKIGVRNALIVTAVLFGLAHFNKRAAYFNWRYVILAAIAGFFYGRAWLDRRRILSSSIAHATVDTVWSIWLR
jgi:membrane protease YdiL (CAAX protease family)